MVYTTSIRIAAPVERVWHCIEDPEQRKRWQEGLEETVYTHVPQGPSPVGTRFVERIRQGRRVQEFEGELLVHEPPRRLVVRVGDRHFSLENTFLLAADADGTSLAFSTTSAAHSLLAKLIMPLAALMLRGIIRKQLRALKALAEAA